MTRTVTRLRNQRVLTKRRRRRRRRRRGGEGDSRVP